MKKIFPLILLIVLGIPFTPVSAFSTTKASLPVPFTPETPDGLWIAPWKNACEEASIVMVQECYLGKPKKLLPKKMAKQAMQPFFNIQNELFGNNRDSNAERTKEIIDDYALFSATIKENPTLTDIKAELDNNHPIITFHYGFDLKNPLIPFRQNGSSFHVMVLTGYDDTLQEFTVNDPAVHQKGLDFRYSYATILDTLHDFDYQTKKADGPARVLFTQPKILVKATSRDEIYVIENNTIRRYISSPQVFKVRNWPWSAIKEVDQVWLEQFPTGERIDK